MTESKEKKKLKGRPRTEDEVGESWGDLGWIIFAIILPPVAVLARHGCCVEVLLTLILTGLMWLPGVTFAWYVIFKKELFGDIKHHKEQAQESTEAWPNPSRTTEQLN